MTEGEKAPDMSDINFAAARRKLERLEAWREAYGAAAHGTAAAEKTLSFEDVFDRFEAEIENPSRRAWLREHIPPAAGPAPFLIHVWEEGLAHSLEPTYRQNLCQAVENVLAAEACAELRPALDPMEEPKTDLPTSLRKATLLRDGATCQLCGRGFPLPLHAYSMIRKAARRGFLLDGLEGKEKRRAEWWYRKHARPPCADHIIPQLWGGPNELWNLWTLCYLCNYWKGARFIPELVRVALCRLEEGAPYAPIRERVQAGIQLISKQAEPYHKR